jgi:hypothetical protein
MLPPLVARKGDKRHTKCEYQNCIWMARWDLMRWDSSAKGIPVLSPQRYSNLCRRTGISRCELLFSRDEATEVNATPTANFCRHARPRKAEERRGLAAALLAHFLTGSRHKIFWSDVIVECLLPNHLGAVFFRIVLPGRKDDPPHSGGREKSPWVHRCGPWTNDFP